MSNVEGSGCFFEAHAGVPGIGIWFLADNNLNHDDWPELDSLAPNWREWVRVNDFKAERNRLLLVPGQLGSLAVVLVGCGNLRGLDELNLAAAAQLSERLPAGDYYFAQAFAGPVLNRLALGFAMGSYRFSRYQSQPKKASPRLAWPDGVDRAGIERMQRADRWARDLINTPACDLGPAELAAEARALASRHGADYHEWLGEALIDGGFPAVYAVGQAASAAPRVCELRFGAGGPKVTLIGKGVCFDTGGLDLKPSSAMGLMKKDMGGAACAMALADLLMGSGLPIQLRVLIPIVENSVSAASFRPGDILKTRKGLTVEVDNTDAEGRLILADCLCAADEEQPDLIVDMATLTGAARVALGAELPALFCNRAPWQNDLLEHGWLTQDPLWAMPLWDGYEDELASKVADMNNVSSGAQAGAIIAALFLRKFIAPATAWIHVDLYAWNNRERPGRPMGAQMQAVRALFSWITTRYHNG